MPRQSRGLEKHYPVSCAVGRREVSTGHDGPIDFDLVEHADHQTQLRAVVEETVDVRERSRVLVPADFEAGLVATAGRRRAAYVERIDERPLLELVWVGGLVDTQQALPVDQCERGVDVVGGLEVEGHEGHPWGGLDGADASESSA